MQPTDPPGILAPHIPADLYRRAEATGQPVVIVVQNTPHTGAAAWQRLLLPFAIAAAVAAGAWGVVAALCWLMDVASHTATVIASAAGPVGAGGITLKLFSKK
ncbi:hypothetical protein ACFY0P_42720 [Streptomyces sp. NPDC001714]|uniref:hypothetical protein n=1 Tax=Streptomyces sp. NPDC001714 TaxID=3364603 RepID=UPI00369D6774